MKRERTLDESYVILGRDLAPHFAVDDDGRGEAAGADASGRQKRDLVVRGRRV